MLRMLTIAALVGLPLAGLAVAHTSPEDPVTCTGGNHNGPYLIYSSRAAGGPGAVEAGGQRAELVLYVVLGSNEGVNKAPDATKASTTTGEYNDADKAKPLSVWHESNTKEGLQSSKLDCRYFDNHPYAGSNPAFLASNPANQADRTVQGVFS